MPAPFTNPGVSTTTFCGRFGICPQVWQVYRQVHGNQRWRYSQSLPKLLAIYIAQPGNAILPICHSLNRRIALAA